VKNISANFAIQKRIADNLTQVRPQQENSATIAFHRVPMQQSGRFHNHSITGDTP